MTLDKTHLKIQNERAIDEFKEKDQEKTQKAQSIIKDLHEGLEILEYEKKELLNYIEKLK